MIKWIKKLFKNERNSKSRNNKHFKRTKEKVQERFSWKKDQRSEPESQKVYPHIIYKPSYKPLPRRYPFKKRRLEDLSKDIKICKGVESLFTDYISLVSSYYARDILILEDQKVIVPEKVFNKVRENRIDIKIDNLTIIRPRRRKTWSMTKFLWECLKESQYVEFEEIKE